jgi:hypothetical protein
MHIDQNRSKTISHGLRQSGVVMQSQIAAQPDQRIGQGNSPVELERQ